MKWPWVRRSDYQKALNEIACLQADFDEAISQSRVEAGISCRRRDEARAARTEIREWRRQFHAVTSDLNHLAAKAAAEKAELDNRVDDADAAISFFLGAVRQSLREVEAVTQKIATNAKHRLASHDAVAFGAERKEREVSHESPRVH